MKFIILSQYDNLYQPLALSIVCREFKDDIVAIAALPTMGTDSGFLAGVKKYVDFLGMGVFLKVSVLTIIAKVKSKLTSPGYDGPFSSISQVAKTFNIPYYYFDSIKSSSFSELIDETSPDLLVSLSCPQIIGKKTRDRFPAGCINVHGAPLPKYRGVMPSFWILKNKETHAASTVHVLEAKIDDGDILVQNKVDVLPEDSWHDLLIRTKTAGAHALIEAIKQIESGMVERKPNLEDDATYYTFPTKEDRKEFIASGGRFF